MSQPGQQECTEYEHTALIRLPVVPASEMDLLTSDGAIRGLTIVSAKSSMVGTRWCERHFAV